MEIASVLRMETGSFDWRGSSISHFRQPTQKRAVLQFFSAA
jgi:hypothetical protein